MQLYLCLQIKKSMKTMKYKTYITIAFLALMLVPSINAKKVERPVEEFDLTSLEYIEEKNEIDLGFDTSAYLPEGFNAYDNGTSLESINYIENEAVELGFDTAAYLPEGFNPYKK